MSTTAHPPRVAADARNRPVAVLAARELLIAGVVFLAYRAGRLVTNDSVDTATANAHQVLRWQGAVHADVERFVQRTALDVPGVIGALNHYYVYVHFPATVAFLVWVFVRHRERYAAVRNWFVGVTMTAMAIHVAFPLAPPRMMSGFVDTLAVFGPTIYPEDTTRSVANQFAAMPSLHFGWALMVGITLVVLTADSFGRRRWLWLAHPAITLVAIVATGNHYVLDAVVAAALAVLVGALVVRLEPQPACATAADALPEPAHDEPAPAEPSLRCPRNRGHARTIEGGRRETPVHAHEVHRRTTSTEHASPGPRCDRAGTDHH